MPYDARLLMNDDVLLANDDILLTNDDVPLTNDDVLLSPREKMLLAVMFAAYMLIERSQHVGTASALAFLAVIVMLSEKLQHFSRSCQHSTLFNMPPSTTESLRMMASRPR